MRAIVVLIVVAGVAGLLSACRTQSARPPQPEPLPYRHSGDFKTQILYLSPKVAVSRQLNIFADVETQTFFTIGKARREGPVLAWDTGDRFENRVKGTIKRAGTSEDGQWLLVESVDYDWEKHQPVAYATAISLLSGELHSGPDVAALQRKLAEFRNMAGTKLEPVEYFFDRRLILRFEEPAGKASAD